MLVKSTVLKSQAGNISRRPTHTDTHAVMVDTQKLDQNARLYVIGDIHGRLDLLDQLITAIHRDVGACGGDSLTVTLGDYVDRGPDSRGVIDRLLSNPFPGDYVALKGNHEALLAKFLDQPECGAYWCQLGGLEK